MPSISAQPHFAGVRVANNQDPTAQPQEGKAAFVLQNKRYIVFDDDVQPTLAAQDEFRKKGGDESNLATDNSAPAIALRAFYLRLVFPEKYMTQHDKFNTVADANLTQTSDSFDYSEKPSSVRVAENQDFNEKLPDGQIDFACDGRRYIAEGPIAQRLATLKQKRDGAQKAFFGPMPSTDPASRALAAASKDAVANYLENPAKPDAK